MKESDGQHDQAPACTEPVALPTPRECPDLQLLERFVVGNLVEPELSLIGDHADQCSLCQSMLTTLDEKQDELLARLRRCKDTDSVETLDEVPNAGHSAQRLGPLKPLIVEEERTEQINKLLAKIAHRDTTSVDRDWLHWAQQTFGVSGFGEPTRIGDCLLMRVLGVGGMGIVFAAHDEQLQRSVAIKVMRPERLADTAARQRFLREARAIAAIQHEHIVPVFQVGEAQNVPYFVMPLLRGRSLEERLQRVERCEMSELLQLSVQIADGIAGAHAQGLIHRDIKPSNVWVEGDDGPRSKTTAEGGHPTSDTVRLASTQRSVKLLDFGLARARLDDEHEPLSEDGVIMGTPAYMSPEQASGGDVDQRSDLFSLGCVLFRMATGKLPFPGRTVTQQLTALIKDDVRPLHELNDELPEEFEELVQQLLQRDPHQRPQSAVEVRDRLQGMLKDLEQDGAADRSRVRRKRQRKLAASRAGRLVMASLVLVVAIGSGLFWKSRQHGIDSDLPSTPISQTPTAEVDSSLMNPVSPPVVTMPPVAIVTPESPESWLQRVSELPPQRRLEEVRAELCRRNPELETTLQFEMQGDVVRGINFGEGQVADIGPLAVLQDLQRLRIGYRTPKLPPRQLTDLSPLSGLKELNFVELEFCPSLRDLSPLMDKPLRTLSLYATPLPDLNWIARSQIRALNLGGRDVPPNLKLLKGSPLEVLELNESPVFDLWPLKDLRLKMLSIASTNVTDLKPLAGMPLEILHVQMQHYVDLSPLTSIPSLQRLNCKLHDRQQLALIQSMTWLQLVNQQPLSALEKDYPDLPKTPPAEAVAITKTLIERYPVEAPSPEPAKTPTVAVKPVVKPAVAPVIDPAAEPVRQLAQRVHAALRDCNPGYTASMNYVERDGRIISWEIDSVVLNDITPMAQLRDLESIYFGNSQQRSRDLADLSPLAGLKLKQVQLLRLPKLNDFSALADMPIEVLGLYGTPLPDLNWLSTLKLNELRIGGRKEVVDLSFVKGMPLTKLGLQESSFSDLRPLVGLKLEEIVITNAPVTDLSPLFGMPLKQLGCAGCPLPDLQQVREFKQLQTISCRIRSPEDINALRSLPDLKVINRQSAKEVLK